jgi:hypothetical protein
MPGSGRGQARKRKIERETRRFASPSFHTAITGGSIMKHSLHRLGRLVPVVALGRGAPWQSGARADGLEQMMKIHPAAASAAPR